MNRGEKFELLSPCVLFTCSVYKGSVMTKCSKCERDRCALDDHKVCLACIGCTSGSPCRRCAPWAEDKWQACLSFYAERDAPGEDDNESEHSTSKSDRDSEPPTLENQSRPEDEEKDGDTVGTPVIAAAAADGHAEQDDDSRESRSRSRSRERYIRTEDRERTRSSRRDRRERERRRSPSREASTSRRRHRDRSNSPGVRESSRRRGRSPSRRVAERKTPERRAPRSEIRPAPLANDGYCDWFSEPRVVFQDDFAGGQHAYEEIYGPQEDPYGQWGAYEDYYIPHPPPPGMMYDPRYARYPGPRLVYQAPRKVVRKRPPKHVRQAQRAQEVQPAPEVNQDQQDDVDDDDEEEDEQEQEQMQEDEQPESSGSSTSDVASDDEAEGKSKALKGKEFKLAVKRIQKLLPFTRAKSSSSDNRTGYSAGSLTDQEALKKKYRSRSLPQPPNHKKAVIALNKFVKSSNKGPKKTFLSATTFPKGMEMSFKLDWYAKEGSTRYYEVGQPSLCEDATLFAGAVDKALQHIPDVIEKTATLARNTLAVSGFLELASAAIEKSIDSNRPVKKMKKDIKTISSVATRAAYHASCNAMLAAANMDLARRDTIIGNMPDRVNSLNRIMLRAAPLGGTNFFDQEVCAGIRKKFPKSVQLPDNNRGGASGRGGGRSRPFHPGRGGRGQPPRQETQANYNNAGAYNRGRGSYNKPAGGDRGRGGRGRGDKKRGQ